MKTGALGLAMIKRSEVFIPYVYSDADPQWPRRRLTWAGGSWNYPDGKPAARPRGEGAATYGYGFLAHSPGDCPRDMTEPEASEKLARRLADYEAAINRGWSKSFDDREAPTQNQFDALADFSWNEGSGAAQQLIEHLAHVDLSDVEAIKALFVVWNKWNVDGRTVENPGLTARRLREVALFMRPVEIAWGPGDIDRILDSVYATVDGETEEFRAGSSVSGDEDPH